MDINIKQSQAAIKRELDALAKQVGEDEVVNPKDASPTVKALMKVVAAEVADGCATSIATDVAHMRKALKTVGVAAKKADVNGDGTLDTQEQKKMSPLAVRLLASAAAEPVPPGPVDPGCSTPPVHTGC